MEIRTVGVVGSGLMGSGIAQECAHAGLHVVLNDQNEAALQKGLDTIASSLNRMVAKEKIQENEVVATLARIEATMDQQTLSRCDLVIEAATENLDIKLAILSKLDNIVSPNAIIATNTSSVSITKLASSLTNPERMIGLHFFNPVPLMSLVEIIRGLQTNDQTYLRAKELATRIGKIAIGARNSPGFVVNRILVPMINEAIFVFQEGLASAHDIDTGMKLGANHPIGPLALADLIGLDTLLAVMEVFHRDFSDPKYRAAPLLREMVDAGHLGRKSGRGFYVY